eukprot:GHVO01023742.1.p1 GENE.GHVO01023742.1~~GHVO01023742.1.p1  ORF type:complete len:242 (+),score=5.51 GHVO01023742.1:118-843(+)
MSTVHIASMPVVHLMGDPIECVAQDKHLGTVIGCITKDEIIATAVKDFNGRVGMLKAHYKWLPPDCIYNLFKTFCMPLYGSVLWDFSHRSVERFYTAWQKGVRSLLWLHPRIHCALFAPICGDLEVKSQLMNRAVRFIRSLARGFNRPVQVCCYLAMEGSRSAVSRTITFASTLTRQPRQALIQSKSSPTFTDPHNEAANQKAGLIRDFLQLRSQLCLNFDLHARETLLEIEYMITTLSTE